MRKELIPLYIGFAVVIYLLAMYFTNFGCGIDEITDSNWRCLSSSKSDWGVTGDFFGGILNPLLSFITIFYVYKTYKGESQNKKNFAIEHIFESIEKILDAQHPSLFSDEKGTQISGADVLILMSRLSTEKVSDVTEIKDTYKQARSLMVWMRTYLEFYLAITSDLDKESRRNFNLALVCRFQQPAIAFGLAQLLTIDQHIYKSSTLSPESFEYRLKQLIFDVYQDCNYLSAPTLRDNFEKFAFEYWKDCKEAKDEWIKSS